MRSFPDSHHRFIPGLAVVAALVCASAGVLKGDVFERGPKISPAYAAAGLKPVHEATLEINGAPASMKVYAADGDLLAVATRFAEALKTGGGRSWFHLGADNSIGFVQDGETLTRFLFSQVQQGRTLLYALTEAYADNKTNPEANALPSDFPVYPGARREVGMTHRETRSRMAAFAAGATVEVIDNYYRQALGDQGWRLLSASRNAAAAGGGWEQIFRKNKTLCIVNCQSDPTSGEALITVLMKDSNL